MPQIIGRKADVVEPVFDDFLEIGIGHQGGNADADKHYQRKRQTTKKSKGSFHKGLSNQASHGKRDRQVGRADCQRN
jgi:hypothetical protein